MGVVAETHRNPYGVHKNEHHIAKGGSSTPAEIRNLIILHNPPKGDRRDAVPYVGNLRFGGIWPGQVGFWRFRSLR